MSEDEQHRLIERFIAAYNAFDVDGMVALVHPECRFQNVSGGVVTVEIAGVGAFRALAEQSAALFVSRCQTVTGSTTDGPTTAVTIAYEGVLAADLPSGMKAGDSLRLDGRSVFEFRDGAIYRLSDCS